MRSVVRRFALLQRLADATQARLAWLNWYMLRPAPPATPELKLHLGCGNIDAPGFVNIDGRPLRHVHHVQPLDRLSGFADNSASLVYASHCLEHFPHRELPRVLREWCRVLRPGGILRISVPNFDVLVDMYLDQGRDVDTVQQPLMGGQDYPFNFHYTALNERLLTSLLHQAGCTTVRRWQHGSEPDTSLPDWSGCPLRQSGRVYAISLNLEGVKD